MLAFVTAEKQVVIPNWNNLQFKPQEKDLAKVQMSCMDFAPFVAKPTIPEQVQRDAKERGGKFDDKTVVRYQPQIELLLGCETGVVFSYDPFLFDQGVVIKYNNFSEVKKQRKVEHVRWFETKEEGANSNKFVVVFDDGTFYVFFKDTRFTEESYQKNVRIPTGFQESGNAYDVVNSRTYNADSGPASKEISREKIVQEL